jgi:flagellar hook-basal body complex protein FliE
MEGIGGILGGGQIDPSMLRSPAIGKAGPASPEVGIGAAPGAGVERAPEFGRLLHRFIEGVDEAQKVSEGETRKILLGQSDNLHQAMIVSEQSGLAFRLLVEVRNKLVEGFQEVMRMQV